ncbi:MAG: VanW family protein [Bacillota bacterium]
MSVLHRNILVVTVVIILGLLAGSSLFAGQYLLAGDTFPLGTFVAGQDLSGITRDEAIRLMSEQTNGFALVEYSFTAPGFTYSIKAGDLGAKLQVARFVDQVMEQEGSRSLWKRITNRERRHYPIRIPIEYDRDKYNQAMAYIMGSIKDPVKISRVKWDARGNPILIPGQDGFRIDPEATFKSLPMHYTGDNKITANLVADFESVSVNPADIKDLVELGSFTTYFDVNNINRSSNLRIAASALNGAVVPPGQEFSFNTAVGPREFSTGYKEAMVILQNEFKPGIGGGICQVSSTLYNAVLLANLPVVERHNHSVAVAYVPTGTDATVTYQAKDLRFRNDTASPICIRTNVQGGKLTVQIFGKRSGPAVKVKIERDVFGVTDFKEIRKGDPELPLGEEKVDHEGVKGYLVRTYRTVYEQGRLVKRELMSSDVYKPLDRLVFVGTKLPLPINQIPDLPPQEIPANPENPAVDPGNHDNSEDPGTDPQPDYPETPGTNHDGTPGAEDPVIDPHNSADSPAQADLPGVPAGKDGNQG